MAATISKAILNYKDQLAASVSTKAIDQKVSEEVNIPTAAVKDEKQTSPVNSGKNIVFKVQIAASSRSLELTKANFKGLRGVSVLKGDKLYRYFYGQANQYKAAKRLKQKAIKAGYEHAFIVAFKDGIKIKISDAISPQ